MSNTIGQSLTALQTAKTDIATAITAKGGTVNQGDGFSDFATDIGTIPSGGATLQDMTGENRVMLTASGVTRISPSSGYDGISQVDVVPRVQGYTAATVTSNGSVTYTPASGYVGFSQVTVNTAVPAPTVQPLKTAQITKGGEATEITPDSPYTSMAQVNVTPARKTLQWTGNNKITANGTYTKNVSEETSNYVGYSGVQIEVDVPTTTTSTETVALDMASGNQVITPTTADAMTQVTVTKPATLSPGNIKNGVNIGGVVGTFEGDTVLQPLNMLNQSESFSIVAGQTPGYENIDGFSSVSVQIYHPQGQKIGIIQRTLQSLVDDDFTNVTSIGNYAFASCTALTAVSIPASVTTIGENAFYKCTSLTSLNIVSSGITSIGDYAFSGCSVLNYISFSDALTSIGRFAFSNCYGLTSISLPAYLQTIDANAFYNCTSLTWISIPGSTTSIGDSALNIGTSTNKATIKMLSRGIQDPPSLAFSALSSSQILKILIPSSEMTKYQNATNWSRYSNLFEAY